MQVRKANRVVLAAAAAVVVTGLVSSTHAQIWQTDLRQAVVSDGDNSLRIYSGGWSDPTFSYAIPLTSGSTQYGVTWNWSNASSFYVLEDNFIQVLWDGGPTQGAIKGPRWSIGYQGFDITFSNIGGGELYVTRRDSNIFVYNAYTGAIKRTMTVSTAQALHGIDLDWNRISNQGSNFSTQLTVGDWNQSAGGYRISATNGQWQTSWSNFWSSGGGLNYLYNSYGYMMVPSRPNGTSSTWWFQSEGTTTWTTGNQSSRISGEAWDWAYTESTSGFMESFWDANAVGWWGSSQTSPSRFTSLSVNQPRGVFFKNLGNPTAPTANSLISMGFTAGGFLDNNTPTIAALVYNSMSGPNQTTALNTAQPSGVANLISGVTFTTGLTMFNAVAATTQPSVFNLFAATTQTSMFPALAVTSRSTLFSGIANTARIIALPTVALTEQVSLFSPLALTNQTSVFNGVAASVQTSLFGALSGTTRGTLFPTLALTTQTTMLPTVALTEQVALFTPLALTTQTPLFSALALTNETSLFNALSTTTQTTLFPTLAATLQMSLFPTLSEASQTIAWPTMASTTQLTVFSTPTMTVSALNNVTIGNSDIGGGSGPNFTSLINNATVDVALVQTSLASAATAVRGGNTSGNAGSGILTLAVPLDYNSATTNMNLSLRAAGALNLNAAISDSLTGSVNNLSLNLVARNALTMGTPPISGDMNLNADILLTGGALNTKSNAGATLINNNAAIVANGGITMTGASFTQTAGTGSITANANSTGNISIVASAGNVTLMNPIVAGGTGAGNIAITAPASADITLGVVTGSGAVSVTGSGLGSDITFTNNVTAGSLTVSAVGTALAVQDDVTSGNFTISGTTGARTFGQDVVVTGTGTLSWAGASFTQAAGTGSISTTANSTGNISITASGGNVTMLNPISAAGTSAGNITVAAPATASITLGEVSGTGTVTVNGSGTAAIGFTSTVDAGGGFVVDATGSAATFDGDLTVGSMTVNGTTGDRIIGNDVVVDATGAITIAGATITHDAGTGSITATNNTTGNISIVASGGDVLLLNPITASGTSAGNVTIGAPTGASITLGDVSGSGMVTVNGNGSAATSFTGDVAAGTFVVNATGAGTLAFDGAVDGGSMTVAKTGGTADYSSTVDLTGTFTMTGGAHVFASTSAVTSDVVTMSNSSTSVSTEAPFVATTMNLGGGSFTTTADLSATTMNLSANTAVLNINAGSTAVDIGTLNGSGGTTQVRTDATFGSLNLGSGGTFNVRNGAEATVTTSLGTTGTVTVQNGSTLNIDSAVPGNSAAITITASTLFMAEEPSSGGSGVTFNSGTIHVGSDATYVSGGGMARFIGSSLGTGKTVIADGVMTFDSPYTISGGRLAVADIANSYNLSQTSGTLQLTDSTFQVTSGGQFEELLTMNSGRVIELTDTSTGTIAADGTLVMSGGRFVVGAGVTMTNQGDIQFTNSNSRLHGDGQFLNQGLVTGTGRLDVSETINDAGGIIRVSAGNYLRMNTNVVNDDEGRIEIQSASTDILNLANDGLVTMSTTSTAIGKPTLRMGTALPSSNTGNIFISGEADIFGDLANADGVIRIGGGGVVNFFDAIDNTSATEFQIAGGSAAVFFDQLTLGGSTISGDGTLVVMGTLNLRPGSGHGDATVEGNVTLGDDSTTAYSVGADADFSGLIVGGQAQLDGSLVLTESGIRQNGDMYDLITASNLIGGFDSITLPDPGWGMNYELRFNGNTVQAVVVPEPAALSALAGLVALGLRRRRH